MSASIVSRPDNHAAMQPPAIPADECRRLLALRDLDLLDTPPSESFDRITRLAARALRVPILLFSLVDESRQWFKSCVGTDATETSREVSFCGHVVFERRPLVVCDAARDARFAGNPLVTGPPHIRAYLGVPLYAESSDGDAGQPSGMQPIGTLCALDVQPRAFREADVDTLREYARVLEESIHSRQIVAQLARTLRAVARS